MVERSIRIREARGSIPRFSTEIFFCKENRQPQEKKRADFSPEFWAGLGVEPELFKHPYIHLSLTWWKFYVENRGIDPRTSRMLSERSTIWASSPGGWGGDQFGNMMGPFFILQKDWRLVLVLLCDQNLLSSLVSRVGKVHSNKDLIDCTPILELYIVSSLTWMTFQTTYYNYIHFNLFGVLFLVVAYISVCSKFPSGEPGYRSPCLSNANRALYHLS